MIYVLLPAYNEEHALEPLCQKIAAAMAEMRMPYQIVVVNDGSKDATENILKDLAARYPLHAITHKYNRGLGETARDGFEYVAETANPEDIVIRMDCDDTHDPKYFPALVARIREGYEVVTTSRYFPGGGQIGVDWYRRTISRIANIILKICFPIPGFKEYTCGYRAYRVAVLRRAYERWGADFIGDSGFSCMVEILLRLRQLGVTATEVPLILRYDLKPGPSKMRVVRTILRTARLLLRG